MVDPARRGNGFGCFGRGAGVGARGHGATIEGAFEAAARATFAIVTDPGQARALYTANLD